MARRQAVADILESIDYDNMPDMDSGMDRRRRVIWIVSFTDLMAILLSFFVLMYSMSSPHVLKWTQLDRSLDQQYGGLREKMQGYAGPSDADLIITPQTVKGLDLSYVDSVLQQATQQLPWEIAAQIRLYHAGDRVILSAPSVLSFDAGSDAVKPKADYFLRMMAPILDALENKIVLVGHVASAAEEAGEDAEVNQQIAGAFQRSVNRAHHIAKRMKAYGYHKNIGILGSGNARFANLPQEFTQESARAFARRVDIVILKDKITE